jgi:uncharacterized protein (TIGR02246 family)
MPSACSFGVGVFAALALACGSAATGPRTPEDCDRLFGERVNAGDVDGALALYEPEATLVRQDGTAATGRDQIRAELATLGAMKPHLTLTVTNTLAGGRDIAVLYDDWIATGIDAKGQPATLSGRAVEVVHRQPDGTWRFVVDAPNGRGAPGSP